MMSDLMREEFEAWMSKEHPSARLHLCSVEHGYRYCIGQYVDTRVQDVWVGWQASRECLVIELQAEPEYPEDPEEAIDDSHMDSYHSAIRMRNACRDSIHAAGVKTK